MSCCFKKIGADITFIDAGCDGRAYMSQGIMQHNSLSYALLDVCYVSRSMLARRMRLDVLDRDKNSIRGDEACGWAYANLDLVAEGQVTEQWLQLRGVPSGEVRIRLLVLSGTDDSNEVW